MNVSEFIHKWRQATLSERAAAQSHFRDLCDLLGQPDPSSDVTGRDYAFEKSVTKLGGGQGFADVWKRGCFAWEYKGKHKNLVEAYKQLITYRESLDNPPLLVVCDLNRFEVHTNFTDTVKAVYAFTLADLLADAPLPGGTRSALDVLRALFEDPARLRPARTTAQATEDAARQFTRLAESLRARGHEPHAAARFLIRLLFCLFAEDVGLLPTGLFTRLVDGTRTRPEAFAQRAGQLFAAMAGGGGFGEHDIKHFNGGLFSDAQTLPLTRDDLAVLTEAAKLDWADIEPSVFGTLFERGLDPGKRAQLGAHYTSRPDILRIVEPVLMMPLRRRWAEVQSTALALVQDRDALIRDRNARLATLVSREEMRLTDDLRRLLESFTAQLAGVRVLDPACGSGNFLYVALRELLDLEKEVIAFAAACDLTGFFPRVDPGQMRGIERNEYAHELAPITIWIGYIQWLRDNAFGQLSEPILRPLETIVQRDAVLAWDADGRPVEPPWPDADIIIGNPPFLGDKKMRSELGDAYVDDLRALYGSRVPGGADLVTYWFERARELIASGQVKRAGLLSTNSIRGGANRKVLDRIKETGNIFMAWADRPWVLNGAAVRVSMVGFDDGAETARTLDGAPVEAINPDLTGASDLTTAVRLPENLGIAFIGDSKKGAFDINAETAKSMLTAIGNPNGRPNSDVIRPWAIGLDVTTRPLGNFIIDFGIDMPEDDAQLYEKPYEYVLQYVKPARDIVRNTSERVKWWIHARPAIDVRAAMKGCDRYIATSNVSKHRLFVWMRSEVLPSHSLTVVFRSDDYFFGVLHSKPHELWALRMGTSLEDRPRYTPTTTFETFPFPWPPGQEPTDDPRVTAVADAARRLAEKRQAWLAPPDATPAELAKRTLTALYNLRPAWLDALHRALDAAVCAAYSWPDAPADAETLERLLALNAARAGEAGRV